jgi:r-opsin
MNPLWHSLLGFALAVFCCIAFLGNLCVVFIFTRTKSLRTPSNLLVVNLAVSDFMIMFTMGPPMIVNCFYETWIFGPFMCQIVSMIMGLG